MSRFEPEEYINDRYKAIEERLAVRRWLQLIACFERSPCRHPAWPSENHQKYRCTAYMVKYSLL